jgi:ABC-2 type transport system ATP-binding protein
MVQCIDLTRDFGSLRAVDHLSLTVPAGEIFGFLGPNGAGKTTTILMIAGLLKPTSGQIVLNGESIQWNSLEGKKIIGYVPDNPFLYEKLTGREFLHFMADIYSVPRKSLNVKIDGLLSLFELESKQDELIQGYSRGMRQKIAICAALIHDPQLIILDEPTVGLDPRGARTLKNVLRDFCQKGRTVFLSTHILEIAEHICDRVAIIHHGRLLTTGSMEEIRSLRGSQEGGLESLFLELTDGGGDSGSEGMS